SELIHHAIQVEAGGLLPDGEFLKAGQPLSDDGLRRHEQVSAFRHPLIKLERLRPALEGISLDIYDLGNAQVGEVALPDPQSGVFLNLEVDLPLVHSQRKQIAIVAPIEEFTTWGCFYVALEERNQIVAIEMDLKRLAARAEPLCHLRRDVRFARRREK